MTMGLPIPAPAPAPPTGTALEVLARGALKASLGLHVTVNAPTWRQILFGGARIPFQLPTPPDGVLAELDAKPADPPPGDLVAAAASVLRAGLSDSRPRGTTPRSISARRTLPPASDAVGSWLRRFFLVTAGPASLRLLVAAGYLTPMDVATMAEVYPQGLDAERMEAMEAARVVTAAAARGGHEADLPDWLNDQLITLMDEERPTDFFQALYEPEDQKQQEGPSASAPPSKIVEQTRPTPSPGGA